MIKTNSAAQVEDRIEVKVVEKRKSTIKVLKGIGASEGVVMGPCRVISRPEQLGTVKKGEILVYPTASPELIPFIKDLKGLLTGTGGSLSILANYARQEQVPHVAGIGELATTLTDGQIIRMDGSKGTVSLL